MKTRTNTHPESTANIRSLLPDDLREWLAATTLAQWAVVRSAFLVFLLMLSAATLPAATFIVDNTLDSGPGSLRQAILDAEASSGFDEILFAIPGSGIKTIQPASALPAITEAVLVDGTSQSSNNDLPSVQLDGISAGALVNGLTISASDCAVRGLTIHRFKGAGILIQNGCCNAIAGNLIGTDSTGRLDRGNGGDGVHILASTSNLIGGTAPADRNVISGNNAAGVRIENGADMNFVRGNFIGVDVTGNNRLANAGRGVSILNADSNKIGGELSGGGNVISGNGDAGVGMENGAAWNVVQGNFIGTDASGSNAVRNGGDPGVRIKGVASTDNLVGGRTSAARNVISGNALFGVLIDGRASRNLVQGNYIGTDLTGTRPIPNGAAGLKVGSASNNTIGGTQPGEGNLITFNTDQGVLINNGDAAAVGNAILGNRIFSNGSLGIDLARQGLQGVSSNDSGDADGGGNGQQNYPVLTLASNTLGNLIIQGTLNTVPRSSDIIVEFFASESCDTSGYGGGEVFLTRILVSTDANGDASFGITLPASVPTGYFITATATLANNTSEFSRCLAITEFQPRLVLRPLSDGGMALDWADDTGQFELEFTDHLPATQWRPVAVNAQVAGNLKTVIMEARLANAFFRLRKP